MWKQETTTSKVYSGKRNFSSTSFGIKFTHYKREEINHDLMDNRLS